MSFEEILEENNILRSKLRQGYDFSKETDKIIPAFIKFQSELSSTKKTSENPFFRSKYADLSEVWDTIKEPLKENNLAVMWFNSIQNFVKVAQKEKKLSNNDKLFWTGNFINLMVREVMVVTMLWHASGQYVKSYYLGTPSDNDDQARGTTITYGRRYGIMSLCGICPEDDDGNTLPQKTDYIPKKEKPKPNPNDMLYDVKGAARYIKSKKCFDDNYQKINDLIDTNKWTQISSLIKSNLGGNIKNFQEWLLDNYKVKFYDIKNETFDEIVNVLKNHPNNIIDHGLV